MLLLFTYSITTKMEDEAPELTLRQKTEQILSAMPGHVAPEVTVMIGLVKLLLEEMDRSELSTLI